MDRNRIVGFGFHPTKEELIGYLREKRLDPHFYSKKIREINIYDYEPPELPELALVQSDAGIWYFFVPIDYRYRNGSLVRRITRGGAWKATGKERDIRDSCSKEVIGTKGTLVFYRGRSTKKDARTDWVMDEYRCKPDPDFKAEFVLVRIRKKPSHGYDSSTPGESVPIHHLTSNSGDHIAVVPQVQSQPLPNSMMSRNSEDHTGNIIFSKESLPQQPNHDISFNRESQPLPNYDLSFYRESQPLPNYDLSFYRESQPLPNYDLSFYRESYSLPLHDISFNRESHSLPLNDLSFNRESKPLRNHGLSSDIEDLVRKNTSSKVEEPPVPAVWGWGALIDCNNRMYPDSFYTQQTQIQLQESSHPCGFSSDDLNVLNLPLDSDQENNWGNSQWVAQDEFDGLEPDINSPEAITGAYLNYDGSSIDGNIAAALLNGL